jgi:hypothetical protein
MFYCQATDELYEVWPQVCVVSHVWFMQRLQSVLIQIIQGVLIQLLQSVLYWDYTGCSYSAATRCSLLRLYRMFLFSCYKVFFIEIIQGVLYSDYKGVLYSDYTGCAFSAVTGCSLFVLYRRSLFRIHTIVSELFVEEFSHGDVIMSRGPCLEPYLTQVIPNVPTSAQTDSLVYGPFKEMWTKDIFGKYCDGLLSSSSKIRRLCLLRNKKKLILRHDQPGTCRRKLLYHVRGYFEKKKHMFSLR